MLNKYDFVSYYADDDSDIFFKLFSQYHTPFTVIYYALSNIEKINELQDILSHFFLQSCHVFGICEIDRALICKAATMKTRTKLNMVFITRLKSLCRYLWSPAKL